MTDVMRNPRVSVGMPVYNQEKYVGAAIEAHLGQTYSDFELVITDNASTDKSEAICRAYAEKDKRVRYYRNPDNLGASGNYRRCFELSNGEYFRWTPSDDLVSLNLLERAVDILDHNPSVFVAYPRTRLIDAEGRIIGDFDEKLHIVHGRPSQRWTVLMQNLRLGNLHYGLSRANPLRKTGLLRNYSGGDFPLIAEMSLYGYFYEIPDAFFYRRMHEEASSSMTNGADVMAYYDPKKREKLFMRNWTHLGAHLRSVARAPIPIVEKLRIYSLLARSTISARREFTCELGRAARHALRSVTGL